MIRYAASRSITRWICSKTQTSPEIGKPPLVLLRAWRLWSSSFLGCTMWRTGYQGHCSVGWARSSAGSFAWSRWVSLGGTEHLYRWRVLRRPLQASADLLSSVENAAWSCNSCQRTWRTRRFEERSPRRAEERSAFATNTLQSPTSIQSASWRKDRQTYWRGGFFHHRCRWWDCCTNFDNSNISFACKPNSATVVKSRAEGYPARPEYTSDIRNCREASLAGKQQRSLRRLLSNSIVDCCCQGILANLGGGVLENTSDD